MKKEKVMKRIDKVKEKVERKENGDKENERF